VRLWNIVPSKPLSMREDTADDLIEYIESVSRHFTGYMALNDIEAFRVSKIETFEQSPKYQKLTVGASIDKYSIGGVLDRAIRNEIYVVAREDGCRFFSFGYDFDAWICVKESDVLPEPDICMRVSDISEDLIKTDWYDN